MGEPRDSMFDSCAAPLVVSTATSVSPAQGAPLLLRGSEAALPAPLELSAGPWQVTLEGVEMRALRFGRYPLVSHVYVAVRDVDWDTIPATISDLRIRRTRDATGASGFRVRFQAHHQRSDIDYAWTGTIVGRPDGLIEASMEGDARGDFDYCRIGFCVLLPGRLAGARYAAATVDGPKRGQLPRLVAPQTIVNGFEAPLFPAFSELTVRYPDGPGVRAVFSGDLFEVEDQRNWTDASFKAYCTPIGLGYPHRAQRGQHFSQRIAIRPVTRAEVVAGSASGSGISHARHERSAARAALRLDAGQRRRLPSLGLGLAAGGQQHEAEDLERLRHLRLDHLRIDVRLGSRTWLQRLQEAVAIANSVGTQLEIALFLPPDAEPALAPFVAALQGAPAERILVFDELTAGTSSTPRGVCTQLRAALGPDLARVELAVGTDGDFAELNRARPALDDAAAITFAMNPQVHASDDRTIIENLEGQAATVGTARSFAEGRRVCVSPVTLKPRFNPAASEPTPRGLGDPPAATIDARQHSLLGACWLLGSIAGLSAARADSVTWFETIGPRGVMSGSARPAGETSWPAPGMVYPMFHVLAELAQRRSDRILICDSSAPSGLIGLTLRTSRGRHTLVGNLSPRPLEATIGPIAATHCRVRQLDARDAMAAMLDPLAYGASSRRRRVEAGELLLRLPAFGLASLEVAAMGGSG